MGDKMKLLSVDRQCDFMDLVMELHPIMDIKLQKTLLNLVEAIAQAQLEEDRKWHKTQLAKPDRLMDRPLSLYTENTYIIKDASEVTGIIPAGTLQTRRPDREKIAKWFKGETSSLKLGNDATLEEVQNHLDWLWEQDSDRRQHFLEKADQIIALLGETDG